MLSLAMLAAFAVGCGDAEQQREAAALRTAELSWEGRLYPWINRLTAALKRLADSRDAAASGLGSRRTDRALDHLASCTEQYDRRVRKPPSRKFARSARLARSACADFERGARQLRAALGAGDPTAVVVAEQTWGRAAARVREANEAMPEPRPLAVLPLPAVSGPSAQSHIDPLLGRIATASTAEVRCWATAEWERVLDQLAAEDDFDHRRIETLLGLADLDGYKISLRGDICSDLAQLAYSDARPAGERQLRIAEAVGVLAHEARHLTKGPAEPVVECSGMQAIRTLARALGAGPRYSDVLARRYATEIYPDVPDEYRSPECHDGGSLDENRESTDWP